MRRASPLPSPAAQHAARSGTCRRTGVLPALLATLALSACQQADDWQLQGVVTTHGLDEISGFAPGPERSLWAIQDGGNRATLYRLDRHGQWLASWPVTGVQNTDWESLARFSRGGQHWLLIADTGDNGGLRRTLQLHVIAEPGSGPPRPLAPAWSVVFRWPDGPRDCEAVAVDTRTNEALLVSKKRQPPELFSVSLGMHDAVRTAQPLGRLAGVPTARPDAGPPTPDERVAHMVTGLDLSPDGLRIAVLTYSEVLIYTRRAGEPWSAAIQRTPAITPLPTLLPQAEAIAWTEDGRSLLVSGEFSPAPIYRLTLPSGK
jgi:hypothetical protein